MRLANSWMSWLMAKKNFVEKTIGSCQKTRVCQKKNTYKKLFPSIPKMQWSVNGHNE